MGTILILQFFYSLELNLARQVRHYWDILGTQQVQQSSRSILAATFPRGKRQKRREKHTKNHSHALFIVPFIQRRRQEAHKDHDTIHPYRPKEREQEKAWRSQKRQQVPFLLCSFTTSLWLVWEWQPRGRDATKCFLLSKHDFLNFKILQFF